MSDSVASSIAQTLRQIEAREARLQAFVQLDAAGALARAQWLDALPMSRRGSLHGMPIAVKEIFDVRGLSCSWGSALHAQRRPARSAKLVDCLVDAGAVVVGITRSTEYALAAEPPTTHPLDEGRSPGASSSGSAAAVGAGLLPLALGSQTIGSTIRPAAYCGTVGFKPSWGRYPGHGMLTLSPALDHPGLLAESMATLLRVDQVIVPSESSAQDIPPPTLCLVPPWWHGEPPSEAVQSLLARVATRLQDNGVAMRREAVPEAVARLEADLADTLLAHDLARLHGRFLQEHPTQVSDDLMGWVQRGQRIDATTYATARQAQHDIIQKMQQWLGPGEVALVPATVDVAPRRGQGSGSRAPQRLWTLTGMPALTLPAGRHDGLPLGLQLVGRRGEDRALLHFASAVESCLSATSVS